jgi:ADP-ribose pyrophosphatase YjhB (NUDIX family)
VATLSGWAFCPRCAARLEGDTARLSCPGCGAVYYAESAPAVSALVTDAQGNVLLARRAVDPDAGLWDVPGGFLEEGEHPLDALRRELLEETGVSAEPGAFVGAFVDTYGDGPQASAVLNLAWEARLGHGALTPADDVSELRWFAPAVLPPDEELAFSWVAPALRAWLARSAP